VASSLTPFQPPEHPDGVDEVPWEKEAGPSW